MTRPLYAELSSLIQARANCKKLNNRNWEDKHEDRIETLVQDYMPNGGGFDNGTKIDLDKSTADKLVITTSFHHMDEHGYYDGWTVHSVIVTPSLSNGINVHITGRDRNNIKEYLHEGFSYALNTVIGKDAGKEIEKEVKA